LTEDAFVDEVFAGCDNGGGDLRLSSDDAGSSQLPIHLLSFNNVANTAQVWTLPTLDYDDAIVIYIWGDNTGQTQPAADAAFGSEAVYPSIFEGVYCFENTANDATNNDAHGTEVDSIGYADGNIGRAIRGLGYNNQDKVSFATNWGLGTTNVSILQWINLDSTSEQGLFFCYGKTNGGGVSFGVGNGTFNDASDSGSDGNEIIALVNNKRWFDTNQTYGTGNINMVYQVNGSGYLRFYKNGSLVSDSDSGSSPNAPDNEGYVLGYRRDAYEYEVDADISLTWVINSLVDADWITTAYNNQSSVSTFGLAEAIVTYVEVTPTVLTVTSSVPSVKMKITDKRSVSYQPMMDKVVLGRASVTKDSADLATYDLAVESDLLEL
jgi:hypothetical protein